VHLVASPLINGRRIANADMLGSRRATDIVSPRHNRRAVTKEQQDTEKRGDG
jgi:hypothetical protein